ncbi:MAG: hypothetical protein ACR2N2_06870 [Acidimicrobiia bacterium]
MARTRLRTLIVVAATTVVVSVFAVPAQAGVAEDIWNVVYQAQANNDGALNQFAVEALGASTKTELQNARSSAHSRLDSIYSVSSNQLTAIGNANPGYESELDQARTQLVRDHDSAHAEVEDIYQTVLDGLLGGTTTTLPPTTTTTTKPRPTTTTSTVPKTTTTVDATTTTTVPPTTTTTVPDTTTTTRATTTTTQAPAAAVPGGGSGQPPASTGETVGVAAPPAVQSTTTKTEQIDAEKTVRMERGVVSGMLESSASVVLPPMIVKFTVAPFIVLEVLFSTLFESAQSFLFPFLLLTAALGWFVWKDSRRKPEAHGA